MLGKYFKLFGKGGDKRTPVPADEPAAGAPLEEIVPLLDSPPRPTPAAGQTVDTAATPSVVNDVLPVKTHGKRTNVADLLQRFLGRQPVLNAAGHLLGYELRLKKSAPPGAHATVRQMLDEMLLASLLDLDIHALRGGRLIFVSLSVHTLDSGFLQRLAGDGLVLAVHPEGEPPPLADRLGELKRLGYRIALDEPPMQAKWQRVLQLADYLRVDARARDALHLGEFVVAAAKQSKAQLIATGVEADELYLACRKLGFQAFQGYAFTRLQAGKPSRLDAQRLRIMELLNLTLQHAEIEAIEAVFKREPLLSYKLLRYINSAAAGLLQPVRSISHALMVLGYDQLYRWLTLLLFASGEPDFRTLALMRTALVRGRFAELLGRDRLSREAQDALFIVGMFSALDALLNLPMNEALAGLTLPLEIKQALLKREGPYGPYLELVLATEEGEEQILATYAAVLGIDAKSVNEAQAQALQWAEAVDQA